MNQPLADRLRPISINDIVGQDHILSKGKPLRNLIDNGYIPNLIFYGPPGTGKTTLAKIIANRTNKSLKKLNGTTASTSDIRDIVNELDTFAAPNGILLYLDEIQYFNKKQQQTLLEFMENGKITLIASTTENPYFYIYNAILSRSTVFEFKLASAINIHQALNRAIKFLEKESNETIEIDDQALKKISTFSIGDVRKAINTLEICILSSQLKNNKRKISLQDISNMLNFSYFRYDKKGDEHYDTLSAFQKSMRGSDPDAAIHYLARLIEANDLISICRRLLVCACEDVGLAYPQIMPIVHACTSIAMQVGLPEARIPLANAVIMICNAPKSNSAYQAINKALSDIENGKSGAIPRNLQNMHFDGADVENKGQFYKYPHDFEHNWIAQDYLPSNLLGVKYYSPGDNKTEQAFKSYWDKIKK